MSANKDFPVVGIGASAGGLAAFEAFFRAMPADVDPDMAFVLVQHLAPDHASILAELIRRYTRMQVFEVEDGITVRPNCIYTIPPNQDLAFLNGSLHLLAPETPHGHRQPIDYFFRSLAMDQHERAICIVLTGTGSDGTLGLRAVKDEGGMAMAQRLDTAEYDGMPRSAIATGLVDYTLAPAEMPAQLIAYATYAFGKLPRLNADLAPMLDSALKKIHILVRSQTGHDFSQYKPSTIQRRIERRMVVNQIEVIDDYVKFLQRNPVELEALFRDLLIGVTQFFREPEAFLALEQRVISKIFVGKPAGAVIRIWTPACSTGEEAYSIAILVQEQMELLRQNYTVQIFATDINREAIATARAGLYPANIAADITPQRLARFFTTEPDSSAYRIHKSIRDLLVFSEQDVIKDPPFSKLDLISCRNLLIYMDVQLQHKLIALFHYALNPGGNLFLGTSESVSEFDDLFSELDRKSKLYQRKEDFHGTQRTALARLLSPRSAQAQSVAKPSFHPHPPLRELTEQALLQYVVPVGVLVNGAGNILYLHGHSGMYLELAPGEASPNNILKMAHNGLRRELTSALRKAVATAESVHCRGLQAKSGGHVNRLDLSIYPLPSGLAATPEKPLYLVVFTAAPPLETVPARQAKWEAIADLDASTNGIDARITMLKLALRAKEEDLEASNEELETSNENLQALYEQMQAVNEELQSTNEELETSKEELQSLNEELSTVNAELKAKVMDLSCANNDMNNLLAGTGVGTVFVDHQLRILRFTPEARTIINLIPGDEGRPVAHIVSNLVGYDRLVEDVQAVLDTLVTKQEDVQTRASKWYTMRILPYRTLDNVIEGAVITFVDISEMVRTREALQKANEVLRLAVVVRDAHDAITVQGLDGRILAWNPGAVRMYGWSEAEALEMNARDLIPPALREESQERVHQLSQAEILEPFCTQRVTRNGAIVEVWMTATALLNESGQMYAIATTERTRQQKASKNDEVRNDKSG